VEFVSELDTKELQIQNIINQPCTFLYRGTIVSTINQLNHLKKLAKINTGRIKPGSSPSAHPAMKDIYWAAGIYEGEGSCHYSRRSIEALVSQKDRWILERLRSLFGGSIPPPHKSGCSIWLSSGSRARGFLMTIYQLLSPRRQAQIKKCLMV
jgi:hypothetical protein